MRNVRVVTFVRTRARCRFILFEVSAILRAKPNDTVKRNTYVSVRPYCCYGYKRSARRITEERCGIDEAPGTFILNCTHLNFTDPVDIDYHPFYIQGICLFILFSTVYYTFYVTYIHTFYVFTLRRLNSEYQFSALN